MSNKIFHANQELQDYLLSSGFVDVSDKIFPDKPAKKAFKKKRLRIYFDYINVSIFKNLVGLYWSPSIDRSELDSFINMK